MDHMTESIPDLKHKHKIQSPYRAIFRAILDENKIIYAVPIELSRL
jgi:hypothetical protein